MRISINYMDYYNSCCLFPLIICVFNCIHIVLVVIDVVINALHHSLKPGRSLFCIFALLILGYLTMINAGRLLNGGWFLLNEKEEDAVTTSGIIEDITDNNRFIFAELGSHYKQYANTPLNGVTMVIDGKQFRLVSYDSFRVGDRVIVRYLPKSKYILDLQSGQSECQSGCQSGQSGDGSLIDN